MGYNTKEKQMAYYQKNRERNRLRRRKYFREYNRRNKKRLKMISMMGGVSKMIAANRLLLDEIVNKTDSMRKVQAKIEFKINQIKKFINIK